MKKIKWIAKLSCGNRMGSAELIEADTEEDADALARQFCIDLASIYGYYQDLDLFGDYDQLYEEASWDEDEEEYTNISELEYYVEIYDPEEHDGELY